MLLRLPPCRHFRPGALKQLFVTHVKLESARQKERRAAVSQTPHILPLSSQRSLAFVTAVPPLAPRTPVFFLHRMAQLAQRLVNVLVFPNFHLNGQTQAS